MFSVSSASLVTYIYQPTGTKFHSWLSPYPSVFYMSGPCLFFFPPKLSAHVLLISLNIPLILDHSFSPLPSSAPFQILFVLSAHGDHAADENSRGAWAGYTCNIEFEDNIGSGSKIIEKKNLLSTILIGTVKKNRFVEWSDSYESILLKMSFYWWRNFLTRKRLS